MPILLKILVLLVCWVGLPGAAGWAGGLPEPPAGSVADPALLEKGRRLFLDYCAHCHGNQGNGDGYNAEFLDKDPAEFSNPEFQSKKSNDRLFRAIQKGGAAVKKSPLMPVFGHTLSEEEIWSLVAFIRHLGKDTSHPVTVPAGASSERPMEPVLTRSDMDSFSRWFKEEGQKKEQTDTGELLFLNKKSCLACHQLNEEGGQVGPSLNRAAFNYRPEWVYAWISNPQAFRPDSKMPNLGLQLEEARALAAFLASFEPAGEEDEDEEEGDEGDEEEGDEEEEEEEKPIPDEWKKYLSTSADPERGKKIFTDPEGTAYCSKCHRVNGEGGLVGPELSLVGTSRTREFLLESLLDPNKVITAGYKTIMILTKDRKFITGIKKNEDESGFDIVDKEGKERHIPRDQVKKSKTQKISTMPGNFKDLLEVQEVADLLSYLGTLTVPAFTASAK
ncbi:Triheme cytochrome c [Candidatus Nitromaritima sp. SCGC AAA799-C22]|nr:Triheme cytochrome c [Candidatus Nitromaritima sp. SCGC AAA799-C22]